VTQVVICTKISSDLMQQFDALASPNRSLVLRQLIEAYVSENPPAVAETSPECPHEEPWAQLATGRFCPECRKRMD
jgi:hypothetical protein